MATINYTVEHNVAAGYVKVEWSGLTGGDDGQPFECAGLKIGSVHLWGSTNGNTLRFQASNEVTPINFATTFDTSGVLGFRTPQLNATPFFVGAVRPTLDGSGGSIGVAVVFVVPR